MDSVRINITPDGRLSRRDASVYLGLSSKTLGNWAYKGLGPRFYKVGNRCFYYLSDLQKLVADAGYLMKAESSSRELSSFSAAMQLTIHSNSRCS